MQYKIRYDEKFYNDLHLIELRMTESYYRNIKSKMNIMIKNLKIMPRAHKTLISFKDINGEYRRMIFEKYSIIYKIKNNEIVILRIFNQKENYLNSKTFILKENFQKYFITK